MSKSRRLVLLLVITFLFFNSCNLFFPSYTLTLSSESDSFGSIVADPDRVNFLEGDEVRLTAVPAEGYVFDSWLGVDSSDGNTALVVMDSNRKVTASFIPKLELSNSTDGIKEGLTADFAPGVGDSWTFMIYLDGDNNLNTYADIDFAEMKSGAASAGNSSLKIVVLKDGAGDGDTLFYEIDSSGTAAIDTGFTVETELNMGDPQTLGDFLSYSAANYSADHYALILWNHGGGARFLETEAVTRQICVDDTSLNDSLFIDELQQAITTGVSGINGGRLDLVGIDACVMATIETAYELRNLADYFVSSMASVSYDGWNYAGFFGSMDELAAASPSAEELSILAVKTYAESTAFRTDQSLSAVKTSGLEGLKSAVDELAAALYSADQQAVVELIRDASTHFYNYDYEIEAVSMPYHDLNDLCSIIKNNKGYLSDTAGQKAQAVIDALGGCVVAAYAGSSFGGYLAPGSSVKRGLSIFFSNGDRLYDGYTHYSYQYWYTAQDLSKTEYWFGMPYGLIDFCNSDRGRHG